MQINLSNGYRYTGTWQFTDISDYTLSIASKNDQMEIRLYNLSWQVEMELTLLKACDYFLDFYVESYIDNMRLRIYPKSILGDIGIEIRDKECFFKKSKHFNSKKRIFESFETIGDTFPDWIEGAWKCYAGGLRFYIRRKKSNKLSLHITNDEHSRIEVCETGYISHSGILMSLKGKDWINPPQIIELIFDSFKKEVACYINIVLPVQKVKKETR